MRSTDEMILILIRLSYSNRFLTEDCKVVARLAVPSSFSLAEI